MAETMNTTILSNRMSRRIRLPDTVKCYRVLIGVLIWMVSLALIPPSASAQGLSKVYSAALQGDMARALEILDSIETDKLSPRDSATAECMRTTFTSPPRSEDLPPMAQEILSAYRQYWQSAMLRRQSAVQAESELLISLNRILPEALGTDTPFTSLDDASSAAKQAITRDGLFALTGVTSPFYELMLWKTQTPRTYHIALPQNEVDVQVVFLDSFVSLGWAAYATCGRAHTGGWATKDSLYAVQSSYDTTSEQFRVSYLAHEGQHFSDYTEFPLLEQPELEYRAKLTELAVSDQSTHAVLKNFAGGMGQDRNVPHQLAQYWVIRNLSRQVSRADSPVTDTTMWLRLPSRRIRHEAERLLRRNGEELHRAGATTVRQFLGTHED